MKQVIKETISKFFSMTAGGGVLYHFGVIQYLVSWVLTLSTLEFALWFGTMGAAYIIADKFFDWAIPKIITSIKNGKKDND